MPYDASVNSRKPTHHVILTDKEGKRLGLIAVGNNGRPDDKAMNRNPIDRTAMKTTQGNSKYSDFEFPYTPIPQDTFTGGRGQDEFERNVTRYRDSFRMNTRREGKAFLGAQESYGTGIRTAEAVESFPGSVTWQALIGSNRYMAHKITVPAGFTTAEVWIPLAKRGIPNGAITVKTLNDNGGAPGTARQTQTLAVASVNDVLSLVVAFSIADTLSATTYWIEVVGAADDTSDNHWRVACDTNNITNTYISPDGSTWSLGGYNLYYRVVDATASLRGFQFDYKGAKYFVTRPASGAPTLKMNGDRGTADANTGSLNMLIDATKNWVTDEHKGGIVSIVGGKGFTEEVPWREIVSNGTGQLTVSPNWIIEHDTTTEYVITGVKKWTTITGHGLTAPVTGQPLVSSKGVIYFPQGDTVNIRRMREYTSAGVWTREYADDGTNKATHLAEGAAKIWSAMNVDSNSNTSVDSATAIAWGTNLTFSGTRIVCGNALARITGLDIYVDDESTEALWVFKEDENGFIKAGAFISLQLREMQTVKSPKNGQAHLVFNTYLYWSLMNGLEQYYRPTLDDIGPNLDEGLPLNRQGPIVSLLGYPGRILAAIDAGSTGYSSILSYDGGGWHEEYRGPYGKSISALSFQVIPGTIPDRLWFIQGADMVWLPFPSETTNPLADSNYRFTYEGAVEMSTMIAGMGDAVKFVKAVKADIDNLNPNHVYCEADYKLDTETEWTPFPKAFDTSPSHEIDLTSTFGLSAKRMNFRLRFQTDDNTITPILRMFMAEAVTRITTKYAYTVPVYLKDDARDLRGEPDEIQRAEQKLELLEAWGSNTMVKMESTDPTFADRLVFLLPLPTRAAMRGVEKNTYTAMITLQDA